MRAPMQQGRCAYTVEHVPLRWGATPWTHRSGPARSRYLASGSAAYHCLTMLAPTRSSWRVFTSIMRAWVAAIAAGADESRSLRGSAYPRERSQLGGFSHILAKTRLGRGWKSPRMGRETDELKSTVAGPRAPSAWRYRSIQVRLPSKCPANAPYDMPFGGTKRSGYGKETRTT